MRIITASIGMLAIYSSLSAYIGWNVYVWLQHLIPLNPWLFALLWFLWVFSFLIGRMGHQWLLFSIMGSYWFAFFEYAVLLTPIANIASLFITAENPALVVGTIEAVVLLLIFVSGSFLAYNPIVRKLEITVDAPEADPLHIVLASDFHLGVLSGKNHLQRFVKKSNSLKPDVVLLAGDLVDDDPIWYARYGMSEVMGELKAKLGVYGILGNHDYYGKKIPLLVQLMEKSGVSILRDETISVENRFYLTGREDRTFRDRPLLETLKPKSDDLPWIVMDHTPPKLSEPTRLGVDLQVSGHTHKGQMWPNRFITKKVFDLDYGHRQINKSHFLVSSGFGFWGPPIRIGSRSELWSIKMNFKEQT
ncbi:metallophosphoesterase [Planococcus sp. N028]|uniref:Metallophosphoesterase n=1 Tax=Planococcus shixiaomingii TaxID=3058393 RepID=A0ABT8N1Y4_9BACL|nr:MULTISPECIES: metallophosphoesterase [unclassified Planococcus (in: firmicutes)]MDN7241905.1 metallophosphoesterase [Planococcus sp. N028]WKA54190.1 metallophosphoesterase [Planococcus sp. N022]